MEKVTPPAKLIVVMAFEDDGEGGLRPAFDPTEFQNEGRATNDARTLSASYPAVIAWSREARPDVGSMASQPFCSSMAMFPIWNDSPTAGKRDDQRSVKADDVDCVHCRHCHGSNVADGLVFALMR